jgi:CBS domain-containing membrane protein
MDTFIDITSEDAMKVARRAEQYAQRRVTESISTSRVMTSPVITVHEDTLMSDAAHIMITERISGLPVVDEDTHLLGIVTEADFLHAIGIPVHQPYHSVWQTLETMMMHITEHDEPASNTDLVKDHMTRNVICSTAEHDIHHLVDLMKKHKVKRIVICDEETRVVGMVTRSNLVKLFFDRYS